MPKLARPAKSPLSLPASWVIGSITQVINEFYDTGFSNSETNYSMYDLIHGGYDTVVYTKEGEFEYNPTVVASHEETENEDGTKTYTVSINDGLVWSDGTPITAKDYVFAILLEKQRRDEGVDSAIPATAAIPTWATMSGWPALLTPLPASIWWMT